MENIEGESGRTTVINVFIGHVLVSQVVARSNVPEYHTSTKDGYAVIGMRNYYFLIGLTSLVRRQETKSWLEKLSADVFSR